MRWYEIRQFVEQLESLEQFLVEMAASEERLLARGLRFAFRLDSAEKGMEVMKSFVDEFSRLRRAAFRFDRALASEIESIESSGKLIEQVSLISLRLRMADAKRSAAFSATLNEFALVVPYLSRFVRSRRLFGEEPINLHRTIINLGRVRGIAKVLEDGLLSRELADNDVMKPSNVDVEHVIHLIDSALSDLDQAFSLSTQRKTQIKAYLDEAKEEIRSNRPSWAKVVGVLVIVAAITSGLADAPNASRTVKAALEYILGTSIEKPVQKPIAGPSSDIPASVPLPAAFD